MTDLLAIRIEARAPRRSLGVIRHVVYQHE
jgi:hypothetical protein